MELMTLICIPTQLLLLLVCMAAHSVHVMQTAEMETGQKEAI